MSADKPARRYVRGCQFYKDGTCRDCGQTQEKHELIPFVGQSSIYHRYACPDLDVGVPWAADPWEPSSTRNPGDLLFDQYG